MRIFQITDYFNNGGGKERFIYDFANKIIDNQNETVVACIEFENIKHWGENISFDVITFDERWEEYLIQFNPDVILWHVGSETLDIVKKLLSKYKVLSLVHNVTCPAGTRLFRDKDKICHKTTGNMCLFNWYFRQCGSSKSPKEAYNILNKSKEIHSVIRKSERVYVATNAMKKILEVEKIEPSKIKIFDITLGNILELGPIKINKKSREIKILYVGRLTYSKGVQYLIKAVAQLLKENVNVVCKIIGSGWYEKELKNLVNKYGITQNVSFIGNIKGTELKSWYSDCDIVVVPSIWIEAAGLIVPEARGYGKPIIVTDIGGLPEWGQMMNNVFVTKHADSKSLAHSLLKVKNNIKMEQDNTFKTGYIDLFQDIRSLEINSII